MAREAAVESAFPAVVDVMDEGVLAVDDGGRVRYANPRMERLTGRAAAELAGCPAADLFSADDADVVQELLESSRSGPARGEARVRTGEGGTTGVAVTALPADGVRALVLADVSAAREVAQELAATQRDYRLLAENSADLVLETAASGAVRWASPSVSTVLGWVPEQVVGRSLLDFVHPDDVRSQRSLMRRVDEGHEASGRTRLRTASGSYRWLRGTMRPVLGDAGEVRARVSGWQDIQGEVEVWQALESSQARYRLLAEHSTDLVFRTRPDGTLDWVAPAVVEMLHRTPESMEGRRLEEFVDPADADALLSVMESASGAHDVREVRLRRADGVPLWVRVDSQPIVSDTGAIVGRVGSARLIEVEHAALARLEQVERDYRVLCDMTAEAVLRLAPDGAIAWAAPSAERLFGWSPTDVVGCLLRDLVQEEDGDALERLLADAQDSRAEGPPTLVGRVRLRGARARDSAGGRTHGQGPREQARWVQVEVRPDAGGGGGGGPVVSLTDVQAEEEALRGLRVSEERFELAIEASPVGTAVVDLDRRFVTVNAALLGLLGRDAEWMRAHRMPDVLHPDDDPDDLRLRAEVLAGLAASRSAEVRLLRADGTHLRAMHSIAPVRDRDGVAVSYVSHFVDVTREREAMETLDFLTGHDALTRLANRSQLEERLDQMLLAPRRPDTVVGVLSLDLADIASVNARHGRAVGDHVLVEVASRLAAPLRREDLVARVGGDQFVIVLPGLRSSDDGASMARQLSEAVAAPLHIDGESVRMGAHVGVAIAARPGETDQALRQSEAALRRARAGEAPVVAFDPQVDGVPPVG